MNVRNLPSAQASSHSRPRSSARNKLAAGAVAVTALGVGLVAACSTQPGDDAATNSAAVTPVAETAGIDAGCGSLWGYYFAPTSIVNAKAAGNVHSLTSIAPQLSLTRPSVATVQTSASTIDTTPGVNDARLGFNGTAYGLVIEEARLNSVFNSRNVAAWPAIETGTVVTGAYGAGPDGTTSASRVQSDGGTTTGALEWVVAKEGTAFTYSAWIRATNPRVDGGPGVQWGACDNDYHPVWADLTPSIIWQRSILSPLTTGSTISPAIAAGFDDLYWCGAATNTPLVPLDQLVDLLQGESGSFATESIITAGATATREADALEITNGAGAVDKGQLSLYLRMFAKGSSTSYAAPAYFFYVDANNYALFNPSNQTVTVAVAGATQTSAPYPYTLFPAGQEMEWFIRAGAGAATVELRIGNGAITTLLDGALPGSIAPTGAISLLSSGITNQFSSWLAEVAVYRNGQGGLGVPAACPSTSVPPGDAGNYPPGTTFAYGAADLANAYNIPTWISAGTTIAVISAGGDNPNAEADLAIYRQAYGLPPCGAGCFSKVTETGSTTGLPAASATSTVGIETSIALDMASAGCPTCRLLLVELSPPSGSPLTTADLITAVNTAAKLGASAIIELASWMPGIDQLPLDESPLVQPGITVFAAARQGFWPTDGNNTSFTDIVSTYPAASRNVIAVGQTDLTMGPILPGETAEPAAWAGCTALPKASYQTDTACSGRTMNDVAATGGPVWTYNTFQTGGSGLWITPPAPGWIVQQNVPDSYDYGAVVATSLVAGIFAQTGVAKFGPSFPYTSNAATATIDPGLSHSAYFNDITTGSVTDNGSAGSGYLSHAGPGYDAPTGWGTPDGLSLAQVNRNWLNFGESLGTPGDPYIGSQGTGLLVLNPGLTSIWYGVNTMTTWASGCGLQVSFSGLPPGVSVTTPSATGPRIEPGANFQFITAADAPLGVQRTLTITGTACGVSHTVQTEIMVEPCVPTQTTCDSDTTCGSIVNNCGQTIVCGTGSCPSGKFCSGGGCCPRGETWNGEMCQIAKQPPPKCGTLDC